MTCYIPKSQPGKEVHSVPIKSSYFLISILTAPNAVVKIREKLHQRESKRERSSESLCSERVSVRMASSTLLADLAYLPQWGDPSAVS